MSSPTAEAATWTPPPLPGNLTMWFSMDYRSKNKQYLSTYHLETNFGFRCALVFSGEDYGLVANTPCCNGTGTGWGHSKPNALRCAGCGVHLPESLREYWLKKASMSFWDRRQLTSALSIKDHSRSTAREDLTLWCSVYGMSDWDSVLGGNSMFLEVEKLCEHWQEAGGLLLNLEELYPNRLELP